MRPIYENTVIQIDVTNACYLKCTNCTRHVGHHKKPYFMDLEYLRKAIDSLQDFPGEIGLMGGDPTLHPKFDEICKIYEEMVLEEGDIYGPLDLIGLKKGNNF